MSTSDSRRLTRVVALRIIALRRELGVSQQDLSDLAQIHPTSLSRIERGLTVPKLDMLARIAIALDTTVAELVQDITPADVHPPNRTHLTARDLIRARTQAASG